MNPLLQKKTKLATIQEYTSKAYEEEVLKRLYSKAGKTPPHNHSIGHS